MQNRQEIISSLRETSRKNGYSVMCADETLSYAFDVILKRDNKTMVIKVMGNVGLLTEEASRSLIAFAKFLDAYPIVIGLSNREEKIEDGVVYTRYSIPIISPNTLLSYITEEEEPCVRAGPGGFYVVINSEKLRRIRTERSLSLGDIAKSIGTTRRTVLMYESGMSTSIDIALKMEEFLGEEIMESISFLWHLDDEGTNTGFKKMKEFERLVNYEISKKGFSIYPIKRSIVNFLMEDTQSSYLGGIEEELSKISRRARYLRELSELSQKDGVLIVKKMSERPRIEEIPVITFSELEEFQDKDELKEVIRERRSL